jgi:hypothetical protein
MSVALACVLSWPGKRAPGAVTAAQPTLVETFEPQRFGVPASLPDGRSSDATTPRPPPPSNVLYYGDNLPILAHLLDSGLRGQARLIYADPPYDSGVTWTRKVRLRQPRQNGLAPVVLEQVQYTDAWPEGAYLQFIYDRLPLLRDLLADDGSLWLHCDHRRAHHLRCCSTRFLAPRTISTRSRGAARPRAGPRSTPSTFPTAHTRSWSMHATAPRLRSGTRRANASC